MLSIEGLLHVGENALCQGVLGLKTLDRVVLKRTRCRVHDPEQTLQIADDDRPSARVAAVQELTKLDKQRYSFLANRVETFHMELGRGPTRGRLILFAMTIAERAIGVAFFALAVFAAVRHTGSFQAVFIDRWLIAAGPSAA
jgi:hypothetical protein